MSATQRSDAHRLRPHRPAAHRTRLRGLPVALVLTRLLGGVLLGGLLFAAGASAAHSAPAGRPLPSAKDFVWPRPVPVGAGADSAGPGHPGPRL